MLDAPEFRLKADQTLEQLQRALLVAADEFGFETDLGGALTIEFEDPPVKFVISPNAPVRQIWVSAHLRSAKLDWDPARDTFVLSETGQTLSEVVAAAVSKQLARTVTLEA